MGSEMCIRDSAVFAAYGHPGLAQKEVGLLYITVELTTYAETKFLVFDWSIGQADMLYGRGTGWFRLDPAK